MKEIGINTSHPYRVLIDRGILDCCGSLITQYCPGISKAETAVIITDDIAGELYCERTAESLQDEGLRTVVYTIPNGEASKNIRTYADILEFMAEEHVTRSDFIVALGGGMVGDMAGFAAATFLRGIPFVQIPTTLLAQVDSSVGGKTGIDLKAGKNLAGAFCQPELVICDPDTLDTLPDRVFAEGCAEVVKYGVLGDEKLFSHLEQTSKDFDREYTLSRCIEMKRDIVTVDEFDTGLRQLLNLGHTLGHAAELLSSFSLYHGEAVSVGMTAVAAASAKAGICSWECAARIENLLRRFGLPTECTFSSEELFRVMQSDKKRKGSSISLIIPKRIGECEIRKMELSEMRSFMEDGISGRDHNAAYRIGRSSEESENISNEGVSESGGSEKDTGRADG